MMEKLWWKSLTIQALAVAIVLKLVLLSGVAQEVAQTLAAELVAAGLTIVAIIADLVAAYGRKRAEGPLVLSEDEMRLP
jgi:hypothetical protein